MHKFMTDTEYTVEILCNGVLLRGLLFIPQAAKGIVIFAHGSGSGRLSPRNQFLAQELQKLAFSTLQFDLLTEEENKIDALTAQYRFDIQFLATRLIAATEWITDLSGLDKLPVGYFGASTGAGAALIAAAKLPMKINTVVSRGGRPDLVGEKLTEIETPILLIVGGDDEVVINLNKQALNELHCKRKLEIVPGATHLFEEPGKLEEVSRLASAWFQKYLK